MNDFVTGCVRNECCMGIDDVYVGHVPPLKALMPPLRVSTLAGGARILLMPPLKLTLLAGHQRQKGQLATEGLPHTPQLLADCWGRP